ncbi:hypothetical protein G7Y89_g14050 [Cudoniella acicularis]|uniref:MYND-type domain-containing protein n=1 Tax=Cudoniella acicularis TaxID=354080 RepID=A0A8H4R845_9HELO|nr:hypothetical protein G7Y89_g14050 [Cudoniella acicularis]
MWHFLTLATVAPCIICYEPSKLTCPTCKSADYCSDECKKKDRALHTLLCKEYSTFAVTNPKPIDEYLSTHRLGFLFPEDSKTPQLVWVKCKLEIGADSTCRERAMLKEYFISGIPEQTQKHIRSHSLQIFKEPIHHRPERNRNQSIQHLLRGYGCPDFPVKGPHIVLAFKRPGYDYDTPDDIQEPVYQPYQDVRLSDLRLALNRLAQDEKIFESKVPNEYMLPNLKYWTSAVKVSTKDGDMRHLQVDKYREVKIHDSSDIFRNSTEIADVSKHLGFPVHVQKCSPASLWDTPANHLNGKAWFNREIEFLMMGVNANNLETWGHPDSKKWLKIPTVLIARKDEKDLTVHQVEALVRYCEEELSTSLKDKDGAHYSLEFRKAQAEKYLCKSAFEKFFQELKAKKLSEGEMSWVGTVLSFEPSRPYLGTVMKESAVQDSTKKRGLEFKPNDGGEKSRKRATGSGRK